MALQCNIDSRGKAIRLLFGLVLAVAGAAMVFLWAVPAGTPAAWGVSVAVLGGGLFALFEARAGWCAVRAMGFHTRY